MTVRQLASWLSDYITWGGEMCADRDAVGLVAKEWQKTARKDAGKNR